MVTYFSDRHGLWCFLKKQQNIAFVLQMSAYPHDLRTTRKKWSLDRNVEQSVH